MIALMREELEDTDALYEEFNKRLDTTESKLKIQRNQWTLLGLYL